MVAGVGELARCAAPTSKAAALQGAQKAATGVNRSRLIALH